MPHSRAGASSRHASSSQKEHQVHLLAHVAPHLDAVHAIDTRAQRPVGDAVVGAAGRWDACTLVEKMRAHAGGAARPATRQSFKNAPTLKRAHRKKEKTANMPPPSKTASMPHPQNCE